MEGGKIVGGGALKVRDDERPRYLLEIATPRADLREFLAGRAGVDLIEADQHHALFTFTRNPGARAKLVRDLVQGGFDLSSFGESTKALEDAYFAGISGAKT
jgi:ABC-2 type transport system ATP-binding protein